MTKPMRYPDFHSGISLPDADLAGEMLTAADLAPPPAPSPAPPPATPPTPPPAGPLDFDPVPVGPRINGWTAARQRIFIRALAESGSVSEACEEAGVNPRSAYRLRLRPGAESFDAAWRRAYELGAHRLTAIAFERAIHGTPREVRVRGEVVGQEYIPSDRLLIFLLTRFDSMRYGKLSGLLPVPVPDPVETARAEMPALLKGLKDQPDLPDYDHHDSFMVLR